MSHILPNFLQVNCSSINLFYSKIGIIQFGAPKIQICLKHPGLFYFQHITRICSKPELHFNEFLGQMRSKFEYTYFKEICFPRSLVDPKILTTQFGCVKHNLWPKYQNYSKTPKLYITRISICPKIEPRFDEFLGLMGSKFGYTYFRNSFFFHRSLNYPEI